MKKYTKTSILTFLSIVLVFSIAGCSPRAKQASKDIKKEGNNTEQRKDNIASTTKKNNKEKTDISDKKEWQGELINEEDHWKKYVNDYYGIEFRFRDEEDILYVRDENKNGFSVICRDRTKKCPVSVVGFNFREYRDTDNKSDYENLREYLDYRWNDYSVDAELIYIKKLPSNYDTTIFEVKAKVYNYYKPTIEHPEKIVEAINIRYYIEYSKLENKNYILSMCDISKDICREALTSFKIAE